MSVGVNQWQPYFDRCIRIQFTLGWMQYWVSDGHKAFLQLLLKVTSHEYSVVDCIVHLLPVMILSHLFLLGIRYCVYWGFGATKWPDKSLPVNETKRPLLFRWAKPKTSKMERQVQESNDDTTIFWKNYFYYCILISWQFHTKQLDRFILNLSRKY